MRTRLTDEQKINIVKLYGTGLSTVEIGKLYNRPHTNIREILVKRGVKMRPSNSYRTYELDINYFEKIDSHEKAQVLGFFYADSYNSENRRFVRVSLHYQDEDYLKFILKALKSNIPIRTQKIDIKNKRINEQKAITINCKKITEDLAKLGCVQAKSLILKFPDSSTVPDEFLNSFLLGYFDGDGGFYKDKRKKTCIRMSFCGTLEFCNVLKDLLYNKFNINSHITKNTYSDANAYLLQICGNKNIAEIGNYLYKNASFLMDRKYCFYKEAKEYTIKYNQGIENTKKRNEIIKKKFKNGEKVIDIANEYGIHKQNIYDIIHGKRDRKNS